MSGVRACPLAGFSRAAWYRKSRAGDQSALRLRIREIARARPRFGDNRVYILRRREEWRELLKRVRRHDHLEGLQLRQRVRKRWHRALHRGAVPSAMGLNQHWSMDCVHDQLEVVQLVTGADVEAALDQVHGEVGLPESITVDHGTELTSQTLDACAYAH